MHSSIALLLHMVNLFERYPLVGRKDGILLQMNEIKRLLEMPSCKLYVIHLQKNTHESFLDMLRQHFSHLLSDRRKNQETALHGLGSNEEDVVISLRA